MGRQIVRGKAAEHVRHFDHGRAAGSEVGHQCVEHASQCDAGRFGQFNFDPFAQLFALIKTIIDIARPRTYIAIPGPEELLSAASAATTPFRALLALAINALDDPNYASAAISDGKLYLKGQRFLYCIGEKKP